MTPRILGTEVEFGVAARDALALDPVSNSILLINSYPHLPSPRALWDYENENPLLDARGFEVEGEKERPGPDYNKLLNKLLANGGRLYVDGAHPEYSSPECTNPRDLVAYEKAGERILEICQEAAGRTKGRDGTFVLYKNNSDGKGNSYGYHENYLLARSVPFERILQFLTPFLVTRQVFAGAGKVGSENKTDRVPYQISQRADFFEVLVDLNTMVKRPIINTRDEPHADPAKYRRLHVIVGDANMSEYSTYLKVGTAMIVLAMIEDGHPVQGIEIEDPVRAIRDFSHDPSLKLAVRMKDGRFLTALQIQRQYIEAAQNYFANHSIDLAMKDVLRKWEEVIERLERDPMLLHRELDWVIKRELLMSYMDRKGCGWDDPRISMMDLQYHDVRQDRGLYYALERGGFVETVVTPDEIRKAGEGPPRDTRAFFRASCLHRFPKEVYAASWSSILFDVGNSTIKRIPLMEPLKGSEALVGSLIAQCPTVEELIARLAA